MKAISKKLMLIQTTVNAPKGQHNNFGKYNYRSAEDIMQALKPVLKDNDCSLHVSDEIVEIGGRVYVRATAHLIDNESAETITNNSYARESATKKGMDESQITGSSSSYARKYALAGLFLLDDNKDADTKDNTQLNPYPQTDFDKYFDQWVSGIQTGRATLEAIKGRIAGNGHELTKDQETAIVNTIQGVQREAA